MTYSRAIMFTKHTDLMPYFEIKRAHSQCPNSWENCKSYYEAKRDVNLILQIRYDEKGNIICRIKCPINPLPIKGEFNVCHLGALVAFLEREGWKFNGNYNLRMFM